jgi:hypothetical protein
MDRRSALLRYLLGWAGWLALSAASGLLAVAGLALVVAARQVADTRQPLFDDLAAVCGPHTLGQSFVATAPNLNRIDLWLAWSPPAQAVEIAPTVPPPGPSPTNAAGSARPSQARRYRLFLPAIVRSPEAFSSQGCNPASGDGSGVVTVSLKAAPASATVIASSTVRLDNLENPAAALRRPYVYQSFAFPPILDSAGRTFYLSVEAPTASVAAPLLARYHHGDVYDRGARYQDGAPTPGDLAFRVYYGDAPAGGLQLLLGRLASGRPAPFDWPWLYPLLLAVYVGCVALVIRFIVRCVARR